MLDYLRGLFLVSLIVSPIYIILGIYSLKYYIVKYRVSKEKLGEFLQRLPMPLKILLSRNLNNLHYDNSEHSPENLERSLMMQRVLISILPVLFIATNILGGFRLVLRSDNLIFVYIIDLMFLCLSLFVAWRFGDKLKYLNSQNP